MLLLEWSIVNQNQNIYGQSFKLKIIKIIFSHKVTVLSMRPSVRNGVLKVSLSFFHFRFQ